MRFTERQQWHYDSQVYGLADTQTALKIHHEYVTRMSPKPPPLFYEVDRRSAMVDPLWHVPLTDRTLFTRELSVPAIIKAERPDWRLTKVGLVPQQKYSVWLSNLGLQEAGWFPMHGDIMFYNGYRNLIVNVVLDPTSYWQQTNVWLGLVVETIIPADGDARPVLTPGSPPPGERGQVQPAPEV